MKKLVFFCVSLIFILNNLLPLAASAYSYGDPNEEKLADAYKEMLLKLDEDPPNFTSARSIFESVKEEVDMHMGKEPGEIILKNIDDEDKKATTENMEKLLVLNIARRLESVDQNFSEYDTSKRLLAKAFATYEALTPKVEGENPEVDRQIRSDFDQALEALGNPGLFGVGQRVSDKEAFNQNKEKIYSSLKEQFNLDSLEVGHFSESATESADIDSGKKEWTDISNIRNWIPLLLIVGVISAIIFVTLRKKKRK